MQAPSIDHQMEEITIGSFRFQVLIDAVVANVISLQEVLESRMNRQSVEQVRERVEAVRSLLSASVSQ
ncbi:MAG: hypothetical protein ACFB8W_19960 [Elainellaceae cyanobacterium]